MSQVHFQFLLRLLLPRLGLVHPLVLWRPRYSPTFWPQPLLGQNPAPIYPRQARQLNQQGNVWLRAKVNQQGQVEEVEIQDSSGFPALDQAAQQTVQGWRFSPAKLNNQPIDSWVIFPISFSLN
ncbi:MAG: energy transducer TonB [Oscillatoriales cyanobacterium RM1_1_9]|nr:energy transducer TonB [Oscillatoriales cyanobacterium RM1_1_9]